MANPRTILRQPLVHFLAIGALLFAADLWRSPPGGDAEATIVVPADVVEVLTGSWHKRTGALPTAAERQGLIDEYVEEEVLYREALAMGFERGDLIIRRRLVQKMEFLLEDLSPGAEPTDAALQDWLTRQAEDYAAPARVEFDHVYLSRDRRGGALEADAAATLASLTAAMSADEAARLGDPSMLPSRQSLRTFERVGRDFGGDFAAALSALPAPSSGDWSGPIASSYGLHLVRVRELVPARDALLDEVRDEVRRDYEKAERHAGRKAQVAELTARYAVEVGQP